MNYPKGTCSLKIGGCQNSLVNETIGLSGFSVLVEKTSRDFCFSTSLNV